MVVVAIGCVIAGTWQISRYEQTARINSALSRNAHAGAAPLTTALVPLTSAGNHPGREAIRYRTVTISGTYLPDAQQLIDAQAGDGTDGFDVLDPLRTDAGVLLVVRGFIPTGDNHALPTAVPTPPTGLVHLTGRLETGSTSGDGTGDGFRGEITTVNPTLQAERLKVPTYDAYLNLDPNQPGSTGLTPLAAPDLSNPAGGAVEPQHFAYIIQWYLFALFALIAPFAMARHEVRDARRQLLGIDPSAEEFDLKWDREHATPLELAEADTQTSGVALATRDDGTVAQWVEPTSLQWQKAAALADRYGRSLGPDHPGQPSKSGAPARRRRYFVIPAGPLNRGADPYTSSYNDYLWQLALADGAVPDIPLDDPDASTTPTVIDGTPVKPDRPMLQAPERKEHEDG